MNIAIARRIVADLEEDRRLEKFLAPQHPPLLSCTEAVRICPGTFEVDCKVELDDDKELCAECRDIEDEIYRQRALREDGHEPFVPYEYLTDRE